MNRSLTTQAHAEVLAEPSALERAAVEVAVSAAAAHTTTAYAGAYKQFLAYLRSLHGGELPTAFDVLAVAGYRDWLVGSGAAASTVALRLTAVRRLAQHLGLDPAIARVRSPTVAPSVSPALTHAELDRLLAMPDLRTRKGKRDLALLHLLASCGLRRSEAVAVSVENIREVRRTATPQHRRALRVLDRRGAERSRLELAITKAKRGGSRVIPLTNTAVDALQDWWDMRPDCTVDTLLVSLPRGGMPQCLQPREVAVIVSRYAARAGLVGVSPHTLRHTFCTLLAESGADLDVIRSLAGHADSRVTERYVHTSAERCTAAIAALETPAHALASAR